MWGNIFSGLGNFFNALLPAANLAGNVYSTFFNRPEQYQPPPPPPPPQPQMQFMMPEMPMFEMPPQPDYSALLASIPRPTAPALDPAMVRQQALGAKANLQSRGVYSGGAVTPESMAALLGIDDPELIYQALGQSRSGSREGMVV